MGYGREPVPGIAYLIGIPTSARVVNSIPRLCRGSGCQRPSADKQGWARVSAVANHMRQHHGQSSKEHGKATWTKVLKGLPGYEFRNEGTTGVAVRISKGG